MAKHNVSIGTFDECVRLYNSITPVKVKRTELPHLSVDVRPSNCRDAQDERIIKVHSNKYVLADYTTINPPHMISAVSYPAWLTYVEAMAPIVWERKGKREFITIRNGSDSGLYNSAFISTYAFLERHLPWGMRFVIRSGLQFIRAGRTEHYLPKRAYLPKETRDMYMASRKALSGRSSWMVHDTSDYYKDKKNLQIKFECVLVNGFPTYQPMGIQHKLSRVVVDKETKRKLKPATEAFWDFAGPASMMLTTTGINHGRYANNHLPIAQDFLAWYRRKTKQDSTRHLDLIGRRETFKNTLHRKAITEIMLDEDHEHRYFLMLTFCDYMGTNESEQSIRAQYNTWINNIFYFFKIVRGA